MTAPRKEFRQGDDASRFSAEDYRAIAEYLEALSSLSVVPPLQLSNGTVNRILSLAHKRGFWAKVAGAANPYGFTELYRDASLNLVANTSGYSGTNMPSVGDLTAYEVNRRMGLDGTIQWLEPGHDDDYRFQDIANGTAHAPPPCGLTVHLQSCDGTPIQGGTVTIDDAPIHTPSRTPIVGSTDASGNYTFPLHGLAAGTLQGRNIYTITWDGATSGQQLVPSNDSVFFCDTNLPFCYDKAKITVSTTAAAAPDLTAPLPGFTETGGGTGTIVLSYKRIRLCALPSSLPYVANIQLFPADASKFLDNCATLTVNCNDDVGVSIPLFEWDTDYATANPSCDQGCAARGEGPNYRGLIPKVLFVTWTATDAIHGADLTGRYFGAYGGVPIEVDWVPGTNRWTSACLPDPGVHCPPGSVYAPTFPSARTGITAGGGAFSLGFALFNQGGCTYGPSPPAPCPPNAGYILGGPGAIPCTFMAPLDATYSQSDSTGGVIFHAHVTE